MELEACNAEEGEVNDGEEGGNMMIGVRMVLTRGVLATAEFKKVSARINFPRQSKTLAHSTFALAANRHLRYGRRRKNDQSGEEGG